MTIQDKVDILTAAERRALNSSRVCVAYSDCVLIDWSKTRVPACGYAKRQSMRATLQRV
jgi:hypothetical protein